MIDFGLLRDKAPQNSFNSTYHNSEILLIRSFSPKTGSFYDLTSGMQMHSVTLSWLSGRYVAGTHFPYMGHSVHCR